MAVQFPEECRNFWFHVRKIRHYYIPDNGVINPEITVNDPVTEGGHILPGNIGLLRFDPIRYIICGFPDHFDCTPYRVGKIIIIDKIFQRSSV